MRGDTADPGRNVNLFVGIQVSDAVPAPNIQHPGLKAETQQKFRHERCHHVNGVFKNRFVENFGSNMTMKSTDI